ncbi:hypothetical protein [Streptomyces sp. TLI_171]|uniref:hypothetical protein n=1 Tax=Streptomyces sp. TLI_171 TaxID=1938859 RepID=UPI000C1929EE|nr:hypothetical protein [Streptomyces sp. TLI_171]RKE04994.1 hypothetical protein BX266_7230 [Streptomyces sp. TLI_171]RKE16803.1 hypothetical protein BX266_0039 [Streptomyces sp. TLI_171]
MRISGWNDLDRGQGVELRPYDYPFWLRVWLRIPILDRFAYPHAVRRNAALPPDRSGTIGAFSYDPDRKPPERLTRYRGRARGTRRAE